MLPTSIFTQKTHISFFDRSLPSISYLTHGSEAYSSRDIRIPSFMNTHIFCSLLGRARGTRRHLFKVFRSLGTRWCLFKEFGDSWTRRSMHIVCLGSAALRRRRKEGQAALCNYTRRSDPGRPDVLATAEGWSRDRNRKPVFPQCVPAPCYFQPCMC